MPPKPTFAGSFTSSSSGTVTTSVNESGDRGNTYTTTASNTYTYSSAQGGNSVDGAYLLSESDTDAGDLTKTAWDGSGGTLVLVESLDSESASTKTGNVLTGQYTVTESTSTRTLATRDTSTGGGSTFTTDATDWLTVTESTTTGNEITGDYTGSESRVHSTSLTQTNGDGSCTATMTTSDSPAITVSGDTVSGAMTLTQTGAETYTVNQKSSLGATQTYTMTGGGTKGYTIQETASAISGAGNRTETGSDTYSLTQTGASGVKLYAQTLTGVDAYTLSEAANASNGGFERSLTGGGGSYTLTDQGSDDGVPYSTSTAATHTFTFSGEGNYVDGSIAQTRGGEDRYALLEQFNNTSNGASGAAPGVVDFLPVGAPFFLGEGVQPPTGGGSFGTGEVAADAVFSELGAGVGSLAAEHVRGVEGVGPLEFTPGQVVCGADVQAAYAELGMEYAYEYCFPAGTMVRVEDGSLKAVEFIEIGDMVLAASEHEPEGPVEPRPVLRVFRNQPARLTSVHVGEQVVRATINHPFYVRGRGWVPAGDLRAGDQLRSHDGRWVEVTDNFDNGEVEPVFNFEVAENRTYFVGTDPRGCFVLVHNRSYSDPTPDPTEGMTWCQKAWFHLTCTTDEKTTYYNAMRDQEILAKGAAGEALNGYQKDRYLQMTMSEEDYLAWKDRQRDPNAKPYFTGPITGIQRVYGSEAEAIADYHVRNIQENGWLYAILSSGGLGETALTLGSARARGVPGVPGELKDGSTAIARKGGGTKAPGGAVAPKRAGTRGRPDHQADVNGPGREQAEREAGPGETVLTERPVQGRPDINRRADNQVVGPDGKTRLVVESERRPTGSYHKKRVKELEGAGIEVQTRTIPRK